MELLQDYIIYILLGLGIAVLVLFILCIVLFVKLGKQKKKYDFFMGANRRPSHNLESKLEKYYKSTKGIEEKYQQLLDMVTDLDKTMKSNIQKVGLVRYNPFEEMGGNLCFALALLDGEDNGIVLNGIHSRTGSFTYAKPIQMGVSIYMLSEEEIKAVQMAKDQAYQPEHEKVIKIKFKPIFRKKDKEVMEEQIPLNIEDESTKEISEELGDVTSAEKEQILQEEMIASQIAAVEILKEEAVTKEEYDEESHKENGFQENSIFIEEQWQEEKE
ncbi:hypothetical protein CLNEO_02350 [Anaerotignum neopropionicum]|uniref:DUF4446 domain-containing protein n=1 Tax=Anaerotignum neopropionicum TaxID=36847 RepID=A0A136WI33_9FIRM|nr:DUF4446 family protein [Anaerotignum neopropionicum]KXL54137.1 hypothetical protein CLNEO_02350 [Anaerotignum neopropionicum]